MLAIFGLLLMTVISDGYVTRNFGTKYAKNTINMSKSLHDKPKTVALTREIGTNNKLISLLTGINCVELPCLQFVTLPVETELIKQININDVIAITSPQAAMVFIDTWKRMNKPDVKILSVGQGTSEPLLKERIKPIFEPSDATAVCFAVECPSPSQLGSRVLYPSSALADNTLVTGLQNRGFQVTRLNTYTIIPVKWTAEQYKQAKQCDIVTFASPSAVKTWIENVGHTNATAVVIGPTTEKMAIKLGFKKVFSPEEGSKGVDAWVKLIREVLEHEDDMMSKKDASVLMTMLLYS